MSGRLGLSVGLGLGGAAAASVVQIATRARLAINRAASTSTTANTATRVAFRNGRKAMKNIRLVYANAYLAADGSEAVDVGAASVRGAIEIDGSGVRNEAKWGGASGYGSIAAGAYLVSDVIPGLVIQANEKFYAHTIWRVTATEYRPIGQYYLATSRTDGYSNSSNLTTIENIFTGASAYGAGDGNNGSGPIGIIGEPVDGSRAECVVMFHDSVAAGSNEAEDGGDADGNRGYVARGFADRGYYLWRLGRAGGKIDTCTPANSPLRSALLSAYASHLIYQLGENNLGSTVAADWEAAVTAWKAVKSVPVIGAKVLCKASSTSGDWTSDGDQTVSSSDQYVATTTTGKHRFNLRIRVEQLVASGVLRGAIDALPFVKSTTPGVEDKWISTGAADYATNDGLHPTPAAHILGKQATLNAIDGGLFA